MTTSIEVEYTHRDHLDCVIGHGISKSTGIPIVKWEIDRGIWMPMLPHGHLILMAYAHGNSMLIKSKQAHKMKHISTHLSETEISR